MTSAPLPLLADDLASCCSPPAGGALDEDTAERLGRVFHALGDRHRVRLLSLIAAVRGRRGLHLRPHRARRPGAADHLPPHEAARRRRARHPRPARQVGLLPHRPRDGSPPQRHAAHPPRRPRRGPPSLTRLPPGRGASPLPQPAAAPAPNLLRQARETYTSATRTGTSMRGPATPARASPGVRPSRPAGTAGQVRTGSVQESTCCFLHKAEEEPGRSRRECPGPRQGRDGYSVAVRARSRTPAVEPTYMSSVMRTLACPAIRDTSVASSFHVNRAVVQNTWRRLCQVRRPLPAASRHPAVS